jgi:hypothetical protein
LRVEFTGLDQRPGLRQQVAERARVNRAKLLRARRLVPGGGRSALRQRVRRAEGGAEHERADDGAHEHRLTPFDGRRGALVSLSLNFTAHRSEF